MVRELRHRAAFEAHGDTYVRVLAQQDSEVGREAAAYLAEKQAARDDEAARLRDAREEETLQLAREANAIAARSARIARAAAWVAGLSAAVSVALFFKG